MVHLVMLVIFNVDVIIFQNFNLLHIYIIFVDNFFFWNEKFQIGHMVSKDGPNYVKWHGSICFQLSCILKII